MNALNPVVVVWHDSAPVSASLSRWVAELRGARGPLRSGKEPNKPPDSDQDEKPPALTYSKSWQWHGDLLCSCRRRSRLPFVCGTFSSWRERGFSPPCLTPSWRYTRVRRRQTAHHIKMNHYSSLFFVLLNPFLIYCSILIICWNAVILDDFYLSANLQLWKVWTSRCSR